jgi:glycosyltransferase involved in cell wall biosynthesis
MITIDVIIPIFNEGEIFKKIICELNYKVKANLKFIICYDNDDESGLKFLPTLKNITTVKNKKKGPNEAILTGIRYSTSEFILVYMADDIHNVELINQFIELSEEYDLIIPSRYIDGGKFEKAKFLKKIIAVLGYILLNKILHIPYKDCTNAFKFFRRNLLEEIKFESKFGFTYAIELTIKTNYLKKKIIEIPSVWCDDENRKSNFKTLKWLPYYLYWAYRALIYQLKTYSNYLKL